MTIILLILFIAVVCFVLYKKKQIYLIKKRSKWSNAQLLPKNRLAKNIILAFDLHGVIFRHNYKKMLYIFINSPEKWKLLSLFFNPVLWKDLIKMLPKHTLNEAIIFHLASNHRKIKPLIGLITEIMNAQSPHKKTINLIKKLKKLGYQIDILSNIGASMYKELKKKHAKIFTLFTEVMTVEEKNNFIAKPNKKLFKLYKKSIPTGKKAILIDDKIKNIKAALKSGIASVYYENFNSTLAILKKLISF